MINFLSGIAEAQSPFKFGFSTLVGGKGYEQVRDVVTDSEGNIYVTGGTSSEDFVVTIGEPLKKGGERTMDIFLRKYAPDGKSYRVQQCARRKSADLIVPVANEPSPFWDNDGGLTIGKEGTLSCCKCCIERKVAMH